MKKAFDDTDDFSCCLAFQKRFSEEKLFLASITAHISSENKKLGVVVNLRSFVDLKTDFHMTGADLVEDLIEDVLSSSLMRDLMMESGISASLLAAVLPSTIVAISIAHG